MAKKKFKKIDNITDSIRLGDLLGIPFNRTEEKTPPTRHRPPPANPSAEARRQKSWQGEGEIWLSKKRRAGKTVSLVILTGLTNEKQKTLFRELKQKFACGVSKPKAGDKTGWVVQTSNRLAVKDFLEKHQIKGKLCG